ncbi:hypothetical protein PLESTF_001853400 [Pleodorina starrii]|nr:hypothetical protein PLESTM_000905100 [Pleodorina starrii]GLC76899.1 hypothetical protein PLESTF_001853400 [Pleodorina starrii]
MGASCTKAGREEAAFLKAAKEGDCRRIQQAILRDVEWACKVQTWNGQSVLHLAARYGRLDVLETVVEAVRFNPAGPDKWTKLLRMGHSTEAILRSFANLQDARCQTPLHLASIYGHHEVAERLLQLGATPWVWDELGGRTPLHYAASMGHVDVIRVIISHNAPPPPADALRRPNSSRTRLVDICNDSGYTPLHYAVWAGNAASVRALTSLEASLSARNVACGSDWVVSCLKCTPLHLAAHKGNAAIVKLLLSAHIQNQPPNSADAPPPATDRRRRDPRRHVNANRQLPYHVAVSRHHLQLSEMLHPDVPFSFILTPEELESRLYGVPKLAALAAKTLQTKLMSDIDAAISAVSATPAAATATAGRGSVAMSTCGSFTAARARSGALAAAASATAQQVLAAATARLRSATERSLHGSTAAIQALEGAVAAAAQSSSPSQRVSVDRLPNGASALAPPPTTTTTVAATPVITAGGGGGTAAGGKATSAPPSDPSSGTSGGDSVKDALPVEVVPDLATRLAPQGGAGNPQPALPLPPAPISPFLPATSAAATAANGAATPSGAAGPPAGGRAPTFNEAASAFAIFAAEPFDEPGGAAAAAAGAGGGGPALAAASSASVSLAVLARSRALQATGAPVPLAASNSISIAVLARSKPSGNSGNKLAPSRSRSLRALLTGGGGGGGKNRRSNTGRPPSAGSASARPTSGGQQQLPQGATELPVSFDDLLQDNDAADDLDEILNAMQPPEDPVDGAAAAAAAAAAPSTPTSARGAAVATRGGRGASASGGVRPFWRRMSMQASTLSGDATMQRPQTPDGGGSAHAGSTHAGSMHAGSMHAASIAPPEELPPPSAGGSATATAYRAPSLPAAVPPGVIESRASTEVTELDVNAATGRRRNPPSGPVPPAAGITPIDSVDDDDSADAATAPPSSARVRRSSISLAALARGGAEAALPPPPVPDHEHVDGAVLAMLASLVEAPQHVLRRYRLLQLTHGLDLQDLLRDHSEQAAAASAVLAAVPGVGLSPRISGAVAAAAPPPASASRTELPSQALPVPPPTLLTNASLRLSSAASAAASRISAVVAAGAADGAAAAAAAVADVPAAAVANATVGSVGGGASPDASPAPAPAPPVGVVTSPSALEGDGAVPSAAAGSPARRLPTGTGLASSAACANPGGAGASCVAPPNASANAGVVSTNLAGQLLRTLSSAAASEVGEGTCGVCFDQPDVLSIAGCGHRLCTDCSRELCKLNTLKPALCPFCRGMIGGFKFVARG